VQSRRPPRTEQTFPIEIGPSLAALAAIPCTLNPVPSFHGHRAALPARQRYAPGDLAPSDRELRSLVPGAVLARLPLGEAWPEFARAQVAGSDAPGEDALLATANEAYLGELGAPEIALVLRRATFVQQLLAAPAAGLTGGVLRKRNRGATDGGPEEVGEARNQPAHREGWQRRYVEQPAGSRAVLGSSSPSAFSKRAEPM